MDFLAEFKKVAPYIASNVKAGAKDAEVLEIIHKEIRRHFENHQNMTLQYLLFSYDGNLPRNLTYRKSRLSYYWRNPVTGQEISLGRISRREAVAQAIGANNYIEENYIPSSLLDRIKEVPEFTFNKWVDRYEVILSRRDLKPNTMRIIANQLNTLRDSFGRKSIGIITTRDIAVFLESYVECGKKTMAAALRSLLMDVFREAVVEGVIERNPAEPTRTPAPEVKRERMTLENYLLFVRPPFHHSG